MFVIGNPNFGALERRSTLVGFALGEPGGSRRPPPSLLVQAAIQPDGIHGPDGDNQRPWTLRLSRHHRLAGRRAGRLCQTECEDCATRPSAIHDPTLVRTAASPRATKIPPATYRMILSERRVRPKFAGQAATLSVINSR